jgi:hypothetical protein
MLRRLFFCLILLVTFIFCIGQSLPPRALPADAPAEVFSASRAAETIRTIARSPRLVGSPSYEAAREYLLQQLQALGFETETQDVMLEGVKVENTLGRRAGTTSSDAILLVAHLDSVPEAPGAMDNASGVAEVLETVRALSAGPALRNTTLVLFTGPEENCCYGARAFATLHPWVRDVRLVINTDAGGVSGPSILAATGPEEGWLIRQMAGVLPHPLGNSVFEAFGHPGTDYSLELKKYGLKGFDFNLSWVKRIHTPLDNIENIHLASIQHQGEHLLAVARHFGEIPLDYPAEPNPVYFDLLGLTIVHYPASWTIPLFILLTLGLGLVLLRAFREKWLRGWGISLGGLAFGLSLVTAPALLLLIHKVYIQPRLFGPGAIHLINMLNGDSLLSNGLRWGSVILAFLVLACWYRIIILWKKADRDEIVTGTYLLLYMLAGFAVATMPSVSYLVIWPLLFAFAAMLIRFTGKKSPVAGQTWAAFFGWLAAALVAVILFTSGILNAILSIEIESVYLVPLFVTVLGGFVVGPIVMVFEKS